MSFSHYQLDKMKAVFFWYETPEKYIFFPMPHDSFYKNASWIEVSKADKSVQALTKRKSSFSSSFTYNVSFGPLTTLDNLGELFSITQFKNEFFAKKNWFWEKCANWYTFNDETLNNLSKNEENTTCAGIGAFLPYIYPTSLLKWELCFDDWFNEIPQTVAVGTRVLFHTQINTAKVVNLELDGSDVEIFKGSKEEVFSWCLCNLRRNTEMQYVTKNEGLSRRWKKLENFGSYNPREILERNFRRAWPFWMDCQESDSREPRTQSGSRSLLITSPYKMEDSTAKQYRIALDFVFGKSTF